MHSLQKQFHDFILANDLVKKGEKVLLAVSGGLDSMVMSHLFLDEGIEFAVAHCNFGLRGEESDGDEAFVLDWADKNGINCFVKAFEIKGSIQVEARNARYEWFNELVVEKSMSKLATAHHLNDSLETILINLSRGTGLKGIAGVPVKNLNIIRPLLFTDKKNLHDYAMDHGIDWREDSSNQKIDYDRNLLRHDVVPELLKLNPSFFKTFGSTVERLSYASEILSKQVEDIKISHLLKKNGGFKLSTGWISSRSEVILLAELLAPFGVNYVTAKDVFEALGSPGKIFPSGEWLISMDRESIYIEKAKREHAVNIAIDSSGEYDLGRGLIVVEEITKSKVAFGESQTAFLDGKELKFPFLVRSWREGDKFRPFGMRGEKKVSDFLIDEKIPLADKKNVLVIECNERIAWVVGMRVSEDFKIKESTDHVVKITFIAT